MKRRTPSIVIAALFVALLTLTSLSAGCTDSEGDAESRVDRINEKLIIHGQPTLTQDTVLDPSPVPTVVPNLALTPGPSVYTPPRCGQGVIEGLEELLAGTGEAIGCGEAANTLYFTTGGAGEGHGGIGLYVCPDTGCDKDAVAADAAGWQFFPGPSVGGMKEQLFHKPSTLYLANGNSIVCFDLVTHQYDIDPGCLPKAPIPSDFAVLTATPTPATDPVPTQAFIP